MQYCTNTCSKIVPVFPGMWGMWYKPLFYMYIYSIYIVYRLQCQKNPPSLSQHHIKSSSMQIHTTHYTGRYHVCCTILTFSQYMLNTLELQDFEKLKTFNLQNHNFCTVDMLIEKCVVLGRFFKNK